MKHKDKKNLLVTGGIFGILIIAVVLGIIINNSKVPTGGTIVVSGSRIFSGQREINNIHIHDSKTSWISGGTYAGVKVCFNLNNYGTSLWTGIIEAQLTKEGTAALSIGTTTLHCDATNPTDGFIQFTVLPSQGSGEGCIEFPDSKIGNGVFAVKLFVLNGCCAAGPYYVDNCQMIEPTPNWGGVLIGYGEVSTSACTSHASTKCWTDPVYGDVYWYDSCGAKEELKTSCLNKGCVKISDTAARCVTCESNCEVIGEKNCDGSSLRTCTQVGDCKQYAITDCGSYGCVVGTTAKCKTCADECELGDAVCSGDNLITCVSGGECLKPVSTSCDYGCAEGACLSEPNGCTPGTQTSCTDPTSGCTGSKTCLSTRLYGICTTTLQKCSDGACRETCASSCTTGDRQDCTASNTCAGIQNCVNKNWASCVKTQDKCTDGTCAAVGACVGLADDADKDGVSDNYDVCPKTPADAKVDAKGCSFLQNYWIYLVAGGVLLLIIAGIILLAVKSKPKFYQSYKNYKRI